MHASITKSKHGKHFQFAKQKIKQESCEKNYGKHLKKMGKG